jgi:arylsulfatase A-like enzyme
MRNRYILIAVGLLVLGMLQGKASPEGTQMPNILIILADDVGWGDIPANYPDALVPMPHVERLAAHGVRFLDAHTTSAVCAPTRYSVLSGNYPWRGRRPYGTWHFNGGSQFGKGQVPLPMLLKEAGYRTAMFGKVHLGAHVEPAEPGSGYDESWTKDPTLFDFSKPMAGGPRDLGFDYSFTSPAGIQDKPYAYFENDLMVGDPATFITWKAGNYPNDNGFSKISKKHDGFGVPEWKSNYYAIDMMDKAYAFLERHVAANKTAGEGRPFFMHYCTEAVHVPHSPPKEFFGEPVLGEAPSHHLDMLRELDLITGRLMTKLETEGLLGDTLIIFTSDNGGLGNSDKLGHDASGGFRSNKGSIYEGGHRVPMIISWPKGGVPAGTTNANLTGIQDLYRTLADIAGVAVPGGQALDSISFKSQLFGECTKPHRIHQMTQTVESVGDLAWRENEWKLIMGVDGQPREFYNLASDPFEENDLIGDPEMVQRTRRMHQEFLALNPRGMIRKSR